MLGRPKGHKSAIPKACQTKGDVEGRGEGRKVDEGTDLGLCKVTNAAVYPAFEEVNLCQNHLVI